MMRSSPALLLSIVLAACGARPAIDTRAASEPVRSASPVVDSCAGAPALPVDLGLTCAPAGADAWLVEVEDVAEVDCDDCDEEVPRATDGRFRLVYRRADGSRARGEAQPFHVGPPNAVTIRALAVHDFDGDGDAELVVSVMTSEHEGGDGSTAVLTAEQDAVVPYAPAAAFAGSIDEVLDSDADGRPDIVAHAPWSLGGFGYSESGGGWRAGPRTLFRALPGGTFVTGGEPGRALWSEDCGSNEHLLPALDDPDDEGSYERVDDAIRNVTCAVLLGGSADEVRARVQREWAERPCTFDPDACTELRDALEARIEAASREPSRSL